MLLAAESCVWSSVDVSVDCLTVSRAVEFMILLNSLQINLFDQSRKTRDNARQIHFYHTSTNWLIHFMHRQFIELTGHKSGVPTF